MRAILIISATTLLLTTAAAQKGAPPDRPQTVRGDKPLEAYDQAIAPYVAKARASYPAAKKRYLAGLPANYNFAVWIRLRQNDQKTREIRHEDVYVLVEAIKKGKIYGRINNKIGLLTNYHLGDRIRFPESEVMNWVITRPDGSEEKNELGIFLDHWKPPKT